MSIYQIVTKAVIAGHTQLRNVAHYEFAGYTPDQSQLQEAVDGLDAAYKQYLRTRFVEAITVYAYDVRRVDVGDLPTVQFVPTAGTWAGTGTGDRLPAQVAALVTFKAETPYPRTTRTYMFPMNEGTNTVSGLVDSATISALDAWAAAIVELTITAGLNADKVAVKYGGDPRVVIDNNEVTTWIVNPVWSTMRSRRLGSGI